MDNFHMVCGLPRSGSTLLCNLLNQNPSFHASSTSALPPTLGVISRLWSSSAEIKSDLIHDKEGTEKRMELVLQNVINSWYKEEESDTIFDKNRGWITLIEQVRHLRPNSLMFCCVRDLREIFASVVRQDRKFPLLTELQGETIYSKAERLFAPDGLIGSPVVHIENALRCGSKNVVFFPYENLVEDPEKAVRRVYAELKMDWFSGHNFDNVENTATDCDALYLNKYPHEGCGKVEARTPTWPQVVPGDISKAIMERYPGYCMHFRYQ